VLSRVEIERNLLPLADLEPEENPRGCLLVLSSHRLIFLHKPSLSNIACSRSPAASRCTNAAGAAPASEVNSTSALDFVQNLCFCAV
jgi:hypothetical protein